MAEEPVKLDVNSLYIHTIPLIGGAFHWAFVHVDRDGAISRHQWAPITSDVQAKEDYIEHALPKGAGSTAAKDPILAYFKVLDYTPADVAHFRSICEGIFPTSYPTVQQNRAANITCRTFVTHVLNRLIGSPQRAKEIEDFVTAESVKCGNTHATDFLFQRPYRLQLILVPKA